MATFTTVLPGPPTERPAPTDADRQVTRRAAAAGVTGDCGAVHWLGWAQEWCVDGQVHPAGWGFRARFAEAQRAAA